MDEWLPVSPRLVNGAFEAFAHWPDAKNAKPLPCPPNTEPWALTEGQRELQMSAAIRFGLTGFADIGAAMESRTLVYDYAWSKDAPYVTGADPRIRATRWGCGFRLALNVWNFDGKFNLSLPAIAAAVELGYANVSYEILGFGVGHHAILGVLPEPTRFDNDAYKKITEATDKLRTTVKDGLSNPVPFAVILATDATGGPLDIARSVHYAAESIYRRRSLETARTTRPGWVDLPTLEHTYEELLGAPIDRAPTEDDKQRARTWLRFGDL